MLSRTSIHISVLIFGLVLTTNFVGASQNPIGIYGDKIVFDVIRNGKTVGEHKVTFVRTEEGLSVDSRLRIDIRFLGLTVYKYRYVSRSIWGGGRLLNLNAAVDDDGKRHNVTAKHFNGRLHITGPAGLKFASPNTLPTNHWNVSVLRSDHVINTITGKLNRVRIERVGEDTVTTNAGPRYATHYRYTGDLDADVWYDQMGRWVKLRFGVKDGSIVEYMCKRCGKPKRQLNGPK